MGMSDDQRRKELMQTAKRAGITLTRGESTKSIAAKILAHDEEAYRAITGMDAPSAARRKEGNR